MIENNEKLFLPHQVTGLFDNALFGPNEKRCIDLMLILPKSIMSREDIYKMVLAPGKPPATVKAEMRKFLASTNAEQYWMARKHQLEVWKGLVQVGEGEVIDGVDVDEIPQDWEQQIKTQAIKKALSGGLDKDKVGEIVLKEVLKADEGSEKITPPIRYLPDGLRGNTYELWALSAFESNKAIKLCDYCKAKKKYNDDIDEYWQFEVPEEVLNEMYDNAYEESK